MKRTLAMWTGLLLAAVAWGESGTPAPKSDAGAECRTCHTSDKPTRDSPALVSCPRQRIWGQHPLSQAPKTITMGELSDTYGPVRFSHRAHAHMAETGEGCYSCHHYNQSRPIFKCGECHEASRRRTDLTKPDLKGARHRQCVECHLQWSHESDCGSCHARKTGSGAGGSPKGFPKAKLPAPIVYDTSSQKGRFVTFRHDQHVGQFGLECTACHQNQTCVGCHKLKPRAAGAVAQAMKPKRSMETLHKPCFSCHADAPCDHCHQDRPGKAVPAP